MRWLVDTSAWARRGDPAVAEQLKELLEAERHELVLSPPVLLELLRGPQKEAVAAERASLTEALDVIPVNPRTFELAADAMERLALHSPTAHRLPVTDLVTAALAHQHELGVVHCDGDYEEIAEHGGLDFEHGRLRFGANDLRGHGVGARQRELRRELAQKLHQLPVEQAETILEGAIEAALAQASSA